MVEIGYTGYRRTCHSSVTIGEIYVFSSHLKPAALNKEYIIHCDCYLWTFFSDNTYTRSVLKKIVKEDDNGITWLRFLRFYGFMLVKIYQLQNTVFILSKASLNITIFIEEHPDKINNYEYIILEQQTHIQYEHCFGQTHVSRRKNDRSRKFKNKSCQVNDTDRYCYEDLCSIGDICRFRFTIPTTSSICIIIFILLTAVSASGTVQWKLKTYPVKFGEEVHTVCTCPKNLRMEHMAWKMYPAGQTIGINDVSTNMSKYNITIAYNESDVIYSLVIKNFNVTDLDHVYKCEFGFYFDSGNISINEREFIALPSEDKIKKYFSLQNGSVNAFIQIPHVYPRPICKAFFKNVTITNLLNTTYTRQAQFYAASITIRYNTSECNGNLDIICFIGMENITFTNQFDQCSHAVIDESSTSSVVFIVVPTVMVLVASAVIVFARYRYRLSRHRNNQNVAYISTNTADS